MDLVLTNMHKYYEPSSVKMLPPFGLSDHNTITISPKQRTSELSSQRTVLKRDTRPTRKAELGRYLSKINWNTLEKAESCEEKNELFSKIISTGVDIIMPERTIKLHSNDAPWVTEDFKRLISLRQRAFSSGKLILFKFYRNKVNRTRNFFTSTFNQLKLSKPKTWWSQVKRIGSMKTSYCNLQSQLQMDNIAHLSSTEIAHLINVTFLEPMKSYRALCTEDLSTLYQAIPADPPSVVTSLTTPISGLTKLKNLVSSKAPGPDSIPNWILKS